MLKAGSAAPDFTLKDHHKNDVKLSGHERRKVLLSFHPLAWTRVCAEQMKSIEANFQQLSDLNTVAFGVSVDTVPSKRAWARELSIQNTPLLCDFWPHGAVARQYGIFRDKDGFSERANIIIDTNQKIAFSMIYDISQLPNIIEARGKGMEIAAAAAAPDMSSKAEVEGEFEPNKDEIARVLTIGIEAEKKAQAKYLDIARMFEDPPSKVIFTGLAEEERKHQNILEDQFYSISNKGRIIWGE
ncbi:redoxin domain-containing protein [candidate division WOR-3 bacterium]|nr:redoxin domain-containing protein [candidate division WOR-3 bacterium]